MTHASATSTGGEATAGPTRRERYGSTGTRATRVIGVLALLGMPLLLLLGLVTSPPDVTMGDSVRIMYVHVPVGLARLPRLRRDRRSARAPLPVEAHAGLTLGPLRRRLGRDRRALHRARARHRDALGPADVGRVLDLGRPPHQHRAAVPALPRLPGPAAAAGPARGAGQAGRHRRPDRLRRRADRPPQRRLVARRSTRTPPSSGAT